MIIHSSLHKEEKETKREISEQVAHEEEGIRFDWRHQRLPQNREVSLPESTGMTSNK